MREIKFRAWDAGEKKMLDDCDLWEWTYEIAFRDGNHQCEFMQFTGLLDKNGKEIYEGDILEGGEQIDGEPRRWMVKWYSTQLNAGWDFGYLPRMDYCEVIGNIHEHPELLKP